MPCIATARAPLWILSALLFVSTGPLGCMPPGPQDGIDAGLDDTLVDDSGWYDPTRLPDGAPNPCLGARDCDECTSRTPCGWCNGSCLSGNADRSDDLTCSGDAWMWRGVQCPGSGSQCGSHADCDSCARDENSCGWCANTHTCTAGDSVGPAQPVSGCDAASGTWIYNLDRMMCL